MDEPRGPGRFKCKFTLAEDTRLTEIVQECGCKNWPIVAGKISDRNARQCRERWMNYINPVLDHNPLSPAEEHLLNEKFAEFGPRWQLIVTFFSGRSQNFIKNHWIMKHKIMETISDYMVMKEERDSNPPFPAQPRPDCFRNFDSLIPDEEKEDIFWETMVPGCF
jgi:hypothetical protein